jgi:sorting nexin-1/2
MQPPASLASAARHNSPPSPEGSGLYGIPAGSKYHITVTDPVKQGEGVGAHISYKVATKTALPTFRSQHCEVIRRFRDFSWLQARLKSQYRGIIIPPLPEKNVVEKYKWNNDAIESRRAALQVFINRVAVHPALQDSPDLQLFLEASETEFAIESSRVMAGMESQPVAAGKKTVAGAVSFLRSLSSGATSLVGKAAGTHGIGSSMGMGGSSSSSSEEDEDPEYLRLRAYMYELEGHLAELHRQASRLVRHQHSMGSAIAEFGASMAALGRYEDQSVSESFARVGEKAETISKVCETTSEELARSFEAPLKEFSRAIKSAKRVMADRSSALVAHNRARGEVESRRVRLAKLRGTPGIQEMKIAEAERDLNEAQRNAEQTKATYELIVRRMGPEMERFQKERAQEMSWVLRDFVMVEGKMAAESAHLWRSLVPGLADIEQ